MRGALDPHLSVGALSHECECQLSYVQCLSADDEGVVMLLSLKQQEGAPPRGSLVVEQFLAKYGQECEAESGQPLKK